MIDENELKSTLENNLEAETAEIVMGLVDQLQGKEILAVISAMTSLLADSLLTLYKGQNRSTEQRIDHFTKVILPPLVEVITDGKLTSLNVASNKEGLH